jgi:hypothetical protein
VLIGGVETNPGQAGEQDKVKQIFSHVKDKEKESKALEKHMKNHNQEINMKT